MAKLLIKTPYKTDYEVIIEQNFDSLASELSKIGCSNNKVMIISDSNVYPIYGEQVIEIIKSNGSVVDSIVLDANSNFNYLDDVNTTIEKLFNSEFTRKDYIITLGGGSVEDFSTFIAATYKRGMNLVHIPTTLMAMSDSSIGGKAGIDYNTHKNMLGLFYNPKLVYSNIACLNTLDDLQYFSGFAEVMKTAIIKSSSVYEWLIENLYEICDKDTSIVMDMIEQTLSIKKIYIEKDPLCINDSLVLNLGHTIGHALEEFKEYSMTHGECVVLGLIAAAHISMKKNMLSLDEYLEIRDMFVPFNLPITIENVDADKILELLKFDKKSENGEFCFILLKKIGKAVIDRTVTEQEIRDALSEIIFSEEDYIVE